MKIISWAQSGIPSGSDGDKWYIDFADTYNNSRHRFFINIQPEPDEKDENIENSLRIWANEHFYWKITTISPIF